jgi:hypothetical protein
MAVPRFVSVSCRILNQIFRKLFTCAHSCLRALLCQRLAVSNPDSLGKKVRILALSNESPAYDPISSKETRLVKGCCPIGDSACGHLNQPSTPQPCSHHGPMSLRISDRQRHPPECLVQHTHVGRCLGDGLRKVAAMQGAVF